MQNIDFFICHSSHMPVLPFDAHFNSLSSDPSLVSSITILEFLKLNFVAATPVNPKKNFIIANPIHSYMIDYKKKVIKVLPIRAHPPAPQK
jgi:hypothetical protein